MSSEFSSHDEPVQASNESLNIDADDTLEMDTTSLEAGSPTTDDEVASRRNALKKAVAATAVVGAVWSAPRVEGFSIVPDYASAGTNTTGKITFQMNGVGPSLAGGNNSMTAAPSPAYNVTSANSSTTGGPVQLTAPLGPAGNAVFVFPNQTPTDGGAFNSTVTFYVDPPFNKCEVLGGTADWEGSTSDRGQTTIAKPPGNQVPNSTSPITVPVPAPGGSPSSGNNFWNPVTRLNWVTIDIQCH